IFGRIFIHISRSEQCMNTKYRPFNGQVRSAGDMTATHSMLGMTVNLIHPSRSCSTASFRRRRRHDDLRPRRIDWRYRVDMTNGHVAQLWRYPVKSLGGGQVEHTEIGERGVLGDRLWAVRDIERDVTASARQLPVLLTATARYLGPVPPGAGPGNVPAVEITFPDGTVLSSSDDGVHAKLSELAGRDVELTSLPPAEDTSLHQLTRAERSETMSPAFLRAAFGVADDEKLPDLSMVRMSDMVNFMRYSTPPGMFVDL